MILKGLIDCDIVNYKKMGIVLEFPTCTFKCDKEFGNQICQNCALTHEPDIDISIDEIINNYYDTNPMTESVIMQGLEPFDSWDDLYKFISKFRINHEDDIAIYTGYNEDEILEYINQLKKYRNIIIKFGRYIPNQESHYDSILGVKLASDNQYAIKIS